MESDLGQASLATAAQRHLANNAPLTFILLLMVDSVHFVFARLLVHYLPATTAAMYVLAIATVQVGLFLALTDKINWAAFWQNSWFFLSIGFLIAGSTALNYTSMAFIDPGTASLLSKTSILFSLGFGLFWLQDRFTPFEWFGVAAAVAGTFIIADQQGEFIWVGVALVIISTFMYALHAALVKRHGARMSLADFFLFRLASSTAFLLLFAAGQGQLAWPSPPAWLLLLLAATVDVTISRTLYYLTLRRLTLSVHTIILTLSPAIAILWTLLLFSIWPTPLQLIGGSAIIAGVVMVSTSQAKNMAGKKG